MSMKTPKKHATHPVTTPAAEAASATSTLNQGSPVPATTTPIATSSTSTEAPSAPSTTASTVVLSTTPAVLDLPPIPPGAVQQDLLAFRGNHPRMSEVAAVPDVVLEVSTSTTYASIFGPSMPAAGPFVVMLQNAAGWTSQRVALEAYLGYAKGQEGLAWKAVRPNLDLARAVYEVAVTKNPTEVPVMFPALTRLFDVNVSLGKKANATRKRNKATKAAKGAAASATANASTTTTSTAAAPAATSPSTTTTTANGGTAH